ncbi:MAG TPA: AraD1 family protein [Chthoniobacteraceae bacterium]
MTRLVQLQRGETRRVALVEEPQLRLLSASFASVHALALEGIASGGSLLSVVGEAATDELLEYDPIYSGSSEWRLLAPFDHPEEPARCLVSGTGLTHLGSAKNRNAMHLSNDAELTDSMRMFRSGLEGGRPAPGQIGTAPEWFYKGSGTVLRAPGEPLEVPSYALDGGEEAELAGVYLIDPAGQPRRVGMAIANEFSDHQFEKTNYLNLAGSKIRACSLGPELVLDPEFEFVPGTATIERAGEIVWRKEIATGEAEMCHSLANIEHHHFKFEGHRRPGDVHVHYYGACALSFGDGVKLADGDVMIVEFAGFGRALRNPLRIAATNQVPVTVPSLA